MAWFNMEHNNILCIPRIPYLYTLTYHNTMINMHWKLSCSDDHMLVDFHGQHNHHTDTPAALSKRDVSLETRAKLLDLLVEVHVIDIILFHVPERAESWHSWMRPATATATTAVSSSSWCRQNLVESHWVSRLAFTQNFVRQCFKILVMVTSLSLYCWQL